MSLLQEYIALRHVGGHETTRAGLIAAMVGRPLPDHYPPRTPGRGEEALRVEPPPGPGRGLALSVRAGESSGWPAWSAPAGPSGRAGWSGRRRPPGERVWLRRAPVTIRSPREARALGIGLVPEDRKVDGLVLDRRYAIVSEADLAEGVKKLATLHATPSDNGRVVIPLPGRTSTVLAQLAAIRR